MKKTLCFAMVLALTAMSAQAETIELKVYGMVCGYCAQGIEKSLRKNPATADVVVSLENKLVAVKTRDGQDISDADLTKTIADAGYDVKGIVRNGRTLAQIRGEIPQAKK